MLLRILEIYSNVIQVTLKVLMLILIGAVTLILLGRYIEFIPRYLWTEELSNFCLVWIIFLGSIIGVKERKHFFVDIFPDTIHPRLKKGFDIAYYAAIYLISIIFITYGQKYFVNGCAQTSPLTGLNLGTIYIAILVSGYSWLIFITGNVYEDFFKKGR